MELVTVYRSFSPADAQLVWSRLDAAGLPAVVTHETAALSTEGYSMSTGGVRVQVPVSHEAEARAMLDAFENLPDPEDESAGDTSADSRNHPDSSTDSE